MEKSNEIVLSVKDFQIIKSASLTFQPGLNAIIGQSNNGKTALFRAAKACIYNEPGTTSVRNGCSQYAVGIQMNGHTVICQKGQSNIYKIDGTLFQKIGRTQLPEVAGALGIRELNLNGSNEQLNFWDQMEKPFLLDRSETELFRFIVDSGKDNNITQALKSLTSDRQGISREITMIEGMIAQAETNIKSFEEKLENSDKVLEVCNRIIQLGPEINRLKSLKEAITKFISLKSNLDAAQSELNTDVSLLNLVEFRTDKLGTEIKKKDIVTSILNNITAKSAEKARLQEEIKALESLEDSRLNEDFNKYKLLDELITKSTSIRGEIQKLNSVKVPDISEEFTNNFNKLARLCAILHLYRSNKSQIELVEASLNSTKLELEQTQNEINSIGICPTCGQPLHN